MLDSSFLSEPDEQAKKNSTGFDIKEPVFHHSKIVERTFDETYDDDFIIRKCITPSDKTSQSSVSIDIPDQKPEPSNERIARGWYKIGDIQLRASDGPMEDQFSLRLIEKKVL